MLSSTSAFLRGALRGDLSTYAERFGRQTRRVSITGRFAEVYPRSVGLLEHRWRWPRLSECRWAP